LGFFLFCGGSGRFTGGFAFSTGFLRGFSLVIGCIFVGETWCSGGGFAAAIFFLFFGIYFFGVPE
jgi:hypothetical protein